MWLIPPPAVASQQACRYLDLLPLNPSLPVCPRLLRCDSRSRYVRPHTPTNSHRHAPALAWNVPDDRAAGLPASTHTHARALYLFGAAARPCANRNLGDSRSPSLSNMAIAHSASRQPDPAVDYYCVTSLAVGPTLSSQAGCLFHQRAHARTHIQHAIRSLHVTTTRRGGLTNLPIAQLFLHCPSFEPGNQRGGA